MVDKLENWNGSFSAFCRGLQHSEEVFEGPEAVGGIVVHWKCKTKRKESLVALWLPEQEEDKNATQWDGKQDPGNELDKFEARIYTTTVEHHRATIFVGGENHRGEKKQTDSFLTQGALCLVVKGFSATCQSAFHLLRTESYVL